MRHTYLFSTSTRLSAQVLLLHHRFVGCEGALLVFCICFTLILRTSLQIDRRTRCAVYLSVYTCDVFDEGTVSCSVVSSTCTSRSSSKHWTVCRSESHDMAKFANKRRCCWSNTSSKDLAQRPETHPARLFRAFRVSRPTSAR